MYGELPPHGADNRTSPAAVAVAAATAGRSQRATAGHHRAVAAARKAVNAAGHHPRVAISTQATRTATGVASRLLEFRGAVSPPLAGATAAETSRIAASSPPSRPSL